MDLFLDMEVKTGKEVVTCRVMIMAVTADDLMTRAGGGLSTADPELFDHRMEFFSISTDSNPLQECIDWAKSEKRTFLRQALEARLIALYIDNKVRNIIDWSVSRKSHRVGRACLRPTLFPCGLARTIKLRWRSVASF